MIEYRVCWDVRAEPARSTTFTHTTQGRPILLCPFHADLHRKGHTFNIYPPKEAQ